MSKNIFNSVKIFAPKSSNFDLSHDVKLSGKMGQLIPIMCMECVPGDKVDISVEALVRFAPLVSPMMHRVDVFMHYFFVPNRLVWPNWENFLTGGDDGSETPAHPYISIYPDGSNYTKLMDYLGIPNPSDNPDADYIEEVSAIPFAAFQKVYNEYYRDQNLIAEVDMELIDGDNTANLELTKMRQRAWEHDYFTAALPFAQKGAAVEIPISGAVTLANNTNVPILKNTAGVPYSGAGNDVGAAFGTGELGVGPDGGPWNNLARLDPNSSLEVSNADTTINDLRRATALQKFLEKLARGGSRYIEMIRTMFGVHSSDKRLQRPEYITGSKSPVVISEVLNTTGTTDAPQGSMAGHGVSVNRGKQGDYFCEEHGYIIGVMSIMPKTAYYQGIPKHFTKTTDRYQYYFPDFANIGEQEVKKRELFAYFPGGGATFGYVPRYAEYKFENNRVAGDFRNNLNFWHMARDFAVMPALNADFVNCAPTTRIFAVEDGSDNLWCHVFNKVYARRLMPKYGTPTF